MSEEKLNALWGEILKIKELESLEYNSMVVLGSVFGQMKSEILILQKELNDIKKEVD